MEPADKIQKIINLIEEAVKETGDVIEALRERGATDRVVAPYIALKKQLESRSILELKANFRT